MVARTSYRPGTPNWNDVSSTDVEASIAFYQGLFGWTCEEAGPAEETGGYRMFKRNGDNVAGLGPHQEGGPPPMWSTYIATEDADTTAEAISAAGGVVMMPPMDVMDAGRMFFAADPTGAAFGVWQARDHIGAEVAEEFGTCCWNEVETRDPDAAAAFYGAVFGWTNQAVPGSAPGSEYLLFALDGNEVAGLLDQRNIMPEEVPALWLPYFAVENVDVALERAVELGGAVAATAMDSPGGRFGVIEDPVGAVFAVMETG